LLAVPRGGLSGRLHLGDGRGRLRIFRSDNQGQDWTRINDDQHQFGWIHSLIGDPRVFGRVYVGTEGRGVQYGQPR
jgi:hypothetical protein